MTAGQSTARLPREPDPAMLRIAAELGRAMARADHAAEQERNDARKAAAGDEGNWRADYAANARRPPAR